MLLLQDPGRTRSTFGVVSLEKPRTAQGQYLTLLTPALVGPVHYSKQHPMAFLGPEWVDYLEQDVADTIVPYEREG